MVKRDWSAAEKKRGPCRVCGTQTTELAHTINRSKQDREMVGRRGGRFLFVHPDSVVSLCNEHHMAYDAHELDLLPFLFINEQINAVDAAGGIFSAYQRLTGGKSNV